MNKSLDCEDILPYSTDGEKHIQVEKMFDTISDDYDKMNRIMSLGLEKRWRKKAILSLKKESPAYILDIATGTGDFAINAYQLLKPEKIECIDLSEKMLDIGRKKAAQLHLNNHLSFQKGDALNLSYNDNTFDAVTIAFGVRNFESLKKGFSEIHRVLKSGGNLVFVELTAPSFFLFKPFYKFYTRLVIPAISYFLTKDKKAYIYLPASIDAFPPKQKITQLLLDCGFSAIQYHSLTCGVCAFYKAKK